MQTRPTLRAAAPGWLLPSVLATLLASAGCSKAPERTITQRRTAPELSQPVLPGATSQQRFGSMRSERAASEAEGPTMPEFDYDLPAGWSARPASGMRILDFQVGGSTEAEAYLTVLGGGGGGVDANIERWQAQMGSAASPASVVERSAGTLLGGEAVVVVIDGRYVGMGEADLQDARMVAAILPSSQFTVFAKMVGPREVVGPEQEAFLDWCASLRLAQTPAAPARPTVGEGSEVSAPSAFAWDLPQGWSELGPRPMRLATLASPEGVEVSVSSAGGSPLMNVNRWLGQVSKPGLDPAGLDALPRIDTPLGPALLVEATGPFSGMGTEDLSEATLLGAIVPLGGTNLFLKAVAAPDAVAGARSAFLEILGSVRAAGK